MIISLVRHGITDYNASGFLQGQVDIDLNEEGWKQAHQLGEFFKDIPVDLLFASDLKRAYHTAECILKAKQKQVPQKPREKHLHLQQEILLRERNFGKDEGNTIVSMRQKYTEAGGYMQYVPEGGESIPQVQDRAKLFFERLVLPEFLELENMNSSTASSRPLSIFVDLTPDFVKAELVHLAERMPHIVITSHGGWIRSFINVSKGYFPAHGVPHIPGNIQMGNCAITTLVFRWKNPLPQKHLCNGSAKNDRNTADAHQTINTLDCNACTSRWHNVSAVTPVLCNYYAYIAK